MDVLYYDRFAKKVVSEKELIAPPERYFEIEKGTRDFYIDRYSFHDGKRLNCTYTLNKSWREIADDFNRMLCCYCKNIGENPEDAMLISRVYPPKEFEKIKERLDGRKND